VKRLLQIILSIVLAVGLVACGGRYSVPGSVLKKAIAISVNQTGEQISQQLQLSAPPKVTIDRVKVVDQSPLKIQGIEAYHLKGSYDFTLKLPQRQAKQTENPFDVYLQRKTEGKTQTWQLAQQRGEDWSLSAIK
jgi:hypothetical protein